MDSDRELASSSEDDSPVAANRRNGNEAMDLEISSPSDEDVSVVVPQRQYGGARPPTSAQRPANSLWSTAFAAAFGDRQDAGANSCERKDQASVADGASCSPSRTVDCPSVDPSVVTVSPPLPLASSCCDSSGLEPSKLQPPRVATAPSGPAVGSADTSVSATNSAGRNGKSDSTPCASAAPCASATPSLPKATNGSAAWKAIPKTSTNTPSWGDEVEAAFPLLPPAGTRNPGLVAQVPRVVEVPTVHRAASGPGEASPGEEDWRVVGSGGRRRTARRSAADSSSSAGSSSSRASPGFLPANPEPVDVRPQGALHRPPVEQPTRPVTARCGVPLPQLGGMRGLAATKPPSTTPAAPTPPQGPAPAKPAKGKKKASKSNSSPPAAPLPSPPAPTVPPPPPPRRQSIVIDPMPVRPKRGSAAKTETPKAPAAKKQPAKAVVPPTPKPTKPAKAGTASAKAPATASSSPARPASPVPERPRSKTGLSQTAKPPTRSAVTRGGTPPPSTSRLPDSTAKPPSPRGAKRSGAQSDGNAADAPKSQRKNQGRGGLLVRALRDAGATWADFQAGLWKVEETRTADGGRLVVAVPNLPGSSPLLRSFPTQQHYPNFFPPLPNLQPAAPTPPPPVFTPPGLIPAAPALPPDQLAQLAAAVMRAYLASPWQQPPY